MVILKETMKVGPKGQIVIPKYFRKARNIFPGSEVNLILEDEEIIIRKPSSNILDTIDQINKNSKVKNLIKPHEAYEEQLNRRHKK